MTIYIKATALALAVTAAGATGAFAGKSTTSNSITPPVFFTVVQSVVGVSASDLENSGGQSESVFIASVVSSLQ